MSLLVHLTNPGSFHARITVLGLGKDRSKLYGVL